MLSKLWGYLAVAIGAVVAVLAFGAKKKSEGRKVERAKQTKEVLDAKERMDDVPEPSSDDTDDRLSGGSF